MQVTYLAHDLDDPSIWRRVEMLRRGGAEVRVAGFRRGTGPLPEPAQILGHTANGRLKQRITAILRAAPSIARTLPPPDGGEETILARNLEMLALGAALQRSRSGRVRLVYELLDIHGMMLGAGPAHRALRRIEAALMRRSALVVISSPAFAEHYLRPYGQPDTPLLLIENKPFADLTPASDRARRAPGGPLVIGWFGMLRCAWSLATLNAVTRANPGSFRVVLRGRPALDVLPDFHEVISANPDMDYGGPYAWPDDLPTIYGQIDVAWLIDRYQAGQNSDWLLPNRLYEGCLNGAVPVVLDGTEVARRAAAWDCAVIVPAPTEPDVARTLRGIDPETLARRAAAVAAIPRRALWMGDEECRDLTAAICGDAALPVAAPRPAGNGRVLIVIPTLNEAAHIESVLAAIAPFAQRTDGRIVVADGGSTDATRQLVQAAAARDARITLLANPRRLQSAAVNRAVEAFGADFEWLLRLDAHSAYPADFGEALLAEAAETGADSVVVSMDARGDTPLQRLIAAAQNSRLGNGGSAHRLAGRGAWVDHGHHALMRMDAFRAVGGYDESFSHNEDAELDHRLGAAGHRIRLTGRTGIGYFPRRRIGPLLRQYFNFGRGRARNLAKHRARPAARQAAVALLAPALFLALLTPLSWIFALPLLLWVTGCLVGGVMIARDMGTPAGVAAGFIAGAMHLAWSAGYWRERLSPGPMHEVSA